MRSAVLAVIAALGGGSAFALAWLLLFGVLPVNDASLSALLLFCATAIAALACLPDPERDPRGRR